MEEAREELDPRGLDVTGEDTGVLDKGVEAMLEETCCELEGATGVLEWA